MRASVGLRRRSRTSGGDGSKRVALEVAVESLAAPHHRAGAAAPACGGDAAFQLGLAKGARRLEAAVGGCFARREKGLRRGIGDEGVVRVERGSHQLGARLRLEGALPAPWQACLDLADDENLLRAVRRLCLARVEVSPERCPVIRAVRRRRLTVRNDWRRDDPAVDVRRHGHRAEGVTKRPARFVRSCALRLAESVRSSLLASFSMLVAVLLTGPRQAERQTQPDARLRLTPPPFLASRQASSRSPRCGRGSRMSPLALRAARAQSAFCCRAPQGVRSPAACPGASPFASFCRLRSSSCRSRRVGGLRV